MLLPAIQERRSWRALKNDSLSPGELEDLRQALCLAPSCANRQSGHFMFVSDPEGREKIHQTLSPGNYWAKPAPVYVVAAYRDADACSLSDQRLYGAMDLGLAVENLLVQAQFLGLVGHPMAGFDPVKLKELFGMAAEWRVMVVIALARRSDDLSGLNDNHRERETGPRLLRPRDEHLSDTGWNFVEANGNKA